MSTDINATTDNKEFGVSETVKQHPAGDASRVGHLVGRPGGPGKPTRAQVLAAVREALGQPAAELPAPSVEAAAATVIERLRADAVRLLEAAPPQQQERVRVLLADGLQRALARLAVVAENPEVQAVGQQNNGEVPLAS
jgi:hypothetical protein